MVRFSLLLLAVLWLCACGSRPQPEQAAQERPAAVPAPQDRNVPVQDDRPAIVAYGDSLSAGFGVPPGESFPDFLQKDLDQAGYGYRVVNAGISGDTTSGGLDRLNNVLALNPQVVLLELGGNDGLRGLPLSATRENLEKMIVGIQKAGATVVLAGMTLPPNYGPDYIRQFEQIYLDLAKKYHLPRIPFLLEGVAGNPSLMQNDGMHPTTEGNRRVARLVLRYLEPVLKKGK